MEEEVRKECKKYTKRDWNYKTDSQTRNTQKVKKKMEAMFSKYKNETSRNETNFDFLKKKTESLR